MVLSETQMQTLQAVLDRLIPPDAYPGAWESGVGEYITRQFERDFQSLHPIYCEGLDSLEEEALQQFQVSFTRLAAEQQDALLRHIEAGEVQADWKTPPRAFFAMLVNHAAEGYYADPGQGGNRNARSWEMIGF